MKYFFLLAAFVVVAGCQPQPQQQIIIREQAPVIIEKTRVIDECNFRHHCGLYSCPVCRTNCWHRCYAHDHCGHCADCRAHGWVGVGIRIGGPRIGIGIGVNP